MVKFYKLCNHGSLDIIHNFSNEISRRVSQVKIDSFTKVNFWILRRSDEKQLLGILVNC